MKNYLIGILLFLIIQPLVCFAGEKLHYYDDPLVRNKHYNFKIQKIKNKAEKIVIPSKSHKLIDIKPFKLKQVYIKNSENLNLKDCYKSFLNKKIDSGKIKQIINNINKKLQKHDLLLSFAYMPQQNSSNGVLNLEIIHGTIRDVKVISNVDATKNKLFNEYIDHIINMYPVHNFALQKNIQLINQIPGYTVKYNLEPVNDASAAPDEVADLILIIDKKRADLSLSVNNQGTKTLGKYEYYALGNLYNVFGLNEKIVLHGGSTNRFDAMKTSTLEVEKFINSYGTSVSLLGTYVEDNPYLVLSGSANDNKSYMYRAAVNHFMILTNKYTFHIVGGYEHRLSKNYTAGSKVSTLQYNDIFAGTNLQFPDFMGGTNYATAYYYHSIPSKTSITRYNSSAQHLDTNYQFVTFDLYRNQNLPKNFSLFTQVLTQHSTNNIPIEQSFFVGGLTSGRGYKTGLTSSNRGIDFTTELRYTKNFKHFLEEAQPYIFYDLASFAKGYASSNRSLLQSAGFGSRFRTKSDIVATAEIGIPFSKEVTVNNVKMGQNVKYSFLLGKVFNF